MFNTIVVGTDGSETAEKAVLKAIELAKPLGASLHVVTAFQPVSQDRFARETADLPEDMSWMVSPRTAVDAILAEVDLLAKEHGITIETYARQGDPADAILDVAEERDADLVIVGNKGMTGAKRFLLGSVPNKVSHHAPCSVLIIRTSE
jgi:nucleotide-binding universal stress UspA family protein